MIGQRLDDYGGVGAGFDAVRLLLASAVLVLHSNRIIQGPLEIAPPIWFASEMIVPMFFALSGFLVTASVERHSLSGYARNRVVRIYPAFVICVLLSALVLGPLVTTLPWAEYFQSRGVANYLLLLSGRASFYLPGVFEQIPYARMVNVSLWSIRWEMLCYLGLGLAAACGIMRRRQRAMALCVGVILAPVAAFLVAHAIATVPGASDHVIKAITPHAYHFVEPIDLPDADPLLAAYWLIETLASWNFRVVPYFAAGALLYLMRYRIVWSGKLAAGMAIMLLIENFTLPAEWNGPLVYLLACAPATYLVVWLGLTDLRLPAVLARGDYSYGVYLFHFPLLQVIHLTGIDRDQFWLNLTIGMPLVLLVAMASWHCIEHPLLRRSTAKAKRFDSPAGSCRG